MNEKVLSEVEQRFVEEYVKDFSGLKAAKRCGYKEPKVTANQMLKREHITQAISDLIQAHNITVSRVLSELEKIAFSDIADYYDIDENGYVTAKGIHELEPGFTRAIEGIEFGKSPFDDGLSRKQKMQIKNYKLYPKMQALQLLLTHLKEVPKDETASGSPVYQSIYSQSELDEASDGDSEG